ncbi:hypothetical protein LZ686_06810 [Paracoccus sp. NFXS7]|uniref:hypothetical protein n=1 Tax=Paracoccus sp. NFXS7 TaxID=2908653 RepID=UPI0032DFD475
MAITVPTKNTMTATMMRTIVVSMHQSMPPSTAEAMCIPQFRSATCDAAIAYKAKDSFGLFASMLRRALTVRSYEVAKLEKQTA